MLDEKESHLSLSQAKQLYALAPVGIIASLINGPILTFIQWNRIPHEVLLSWLFALIVVNGLWIVLWYQFQQALSQGPIHPRCWINFFIAGTFSSGCIWGITGVVSFPELSIPHQIFLAFVLGGMIAGATAVYAALPEAFLAFTLPTMTPILIRFFATGDKLHLAMGGMGMLYVGLMFVTQRHNHKVIVASMTLSRELGKANRSLQAEVHERQQAEVALRESQEQLQSVVQATDDGIISLNSQGEVLFWNKGAEQLFGFSMKEMQGRNVGTNYS